MEVIERLQSVIHSYPEWVAAVGIVIGILGLASSYYFYARNKLVRRLSFATRTFRLVPKRAGSFDGLRCEYRGQSVSALSVVRLAVWNAGTETLRVSDIARSDPLVIISREGVRLLDVVISEQSRGAIAANVAWSPQQTEPVKVTFEFLDPGDGFVIQVVHSGTAVNDVQLTGAIAGARIRTAAVDPETTTTIASPHAAVTFVHVQSGREANRFSTSMAMVGAAFLAVFALLFGWTAGYWLAGFLLLIGGAQRLWARRVYPPLRLRSFDDDL